MADERQASLDRWETMAAGWKATRATFQHIALPISRWMVDAIRPQPGHRILELAAGLGDTGLLAAERVGPDGSVLITDGTEGMVAAAGGRVALAVWDALEHNPWMGVIRQALVDSGVAPAAVPDGPGPFSLGSPDAVRELLDTTGFDDVEVQPLDLSVDFPSVDAWWDHVMLTSGSTVELVRALSPADHYRLRERVDAGYAPYVRDDGSLDVPARALVAAATA